MLIGFLECSLQVNLQLSALGIISVAGGPWHHQSYYGLVTLASIGFNICIMFMKLFSLYDIICLYKMVQKFIETPDFRQGSELSCKEAREWKAIRWWYRGTCFSGLLYVGMVFYAGMKLIAFAHCPEYMMNLTGCVSFPHDWVR